MAGKKRKEPISRDRIKRLIHNKGMTYQQFCDALAADTKRKFPMETFQYCMNNGEMVPDMIDDIAYYFDVSREYIKGETMFYFDGSGNVRDDIPFDDEEGTCIGSYDDSLPDDYFEEEKKREQELKEKRIAQRFIEWIKEDADAVSFPDEKDLIITLNDYIKDESRFHEYGIPYSPKQLRNTAIKAIKEQIKRDYETLHLMENYQNRKKERKTKNE